MADFVPCDSILQRTYPALFSAPNVSAHGDFNCNLPQVTVRDLVQVETGDVRVNGEVVPDADKASHVTVKPRSGSTTTGRNIMFKQFTKGFSKEVKLSSLSCAIRVKLLHPQPSTLFFVLFLPISVVFFYLGKLLF